MSAHIYTSALAEGQLWLLVPHQGQCPDLVSCDFRIVSLNDRPVYRALSYVWSDATDVPSITLCGSTHEATVTMESALRHLCFLDNDRVLWVDALYVDQSNI